MMAKKSEILAEKRTQLAEVRTELAYKRTMSADMRTTATLVLFGIAFIGFSEFSWDFFFTAGVAAIILGVIYLVSALRVGLKHSRKIRIIKDVFNKILKKTGSEMQSYKDSLQKTNIDR
ncbi:hypothetical protein GF351_03100 [Candidatus Woesearchaeota archaeon]|nr:hypothetical protein [Candidatus Woesearchaeota archaeon]